MRLRTKTVQTLCECAIRPLVACVYSVGTVFLHAITVGNAWPYFSASVSLPQQKSGATFLNVTPLTPPSSTNADQCLPLLKSYLQPLNPPSFEASARLVKVLLSFSMKTSDLPPDKEGDSRKACAF